MSWKIIKLSWKLKRIKRAGVFNFQTKKKNIKKFKKCYALHAVNPEYVVCILFLYIPYENKMRAKSWKQVRLAAVVSENFMRAKGRRSPSYKNPILATTATKQNKKKEVRLLCFSWDNWNFVSMSVVQG